MTFPESGHFAQQISKCQIILEYLANTRTNRHMKLIPIDCSKFSAGILCDNSYSLEKLLNISGLFFDQTEICSE